LRAEKILIDISDYQVNKITSFACQITPDSGELSR